MTEQQTTQQTNRQTNLRTTQEDNRSQLLPNLIIYVVLVIAFGPSIISVLLPWMLSTIAQVFISIGWLWFLGVLFQRTANLLAMLFLPIQIAVFFYAAYHTYNYVYKVLAPNNCSFTFVKENTVKYIYKGGEFNKALIQKKGYTLDSQWEVVEEGTPDSKTKNPCYEPRHLFGGLRFYGLFPTYDVYIFKRRWTDVWEDNTETPHEEWLDFEVLADKTLLLTVANAEDKNLLPLTVKNAITLGITNVYKARFAAQDLLETIFPRIQAVERESVANDEYKNLVAQKQTVAKELYGKMLEAKLVNKVVDGKVTEKGEFDERYGHDVKTINITDIVPPTDYLKTTLAVYAAEQNKKVSDIGAEAEKKKIETVAEAEKNRIETVYKTIQSFGDLGKLLRTLDSLENSKSPLTAAVAIQAIPGLQEIFRGVFGKSAEETTVKELKEGLKELRESVEKLIQAQQEKGAEKTN